MTNRYKKPFLVAKQGGYEVWASFDAEAQVFTCCLSKDMDDPIGEASNKQECKRVAAYWFNEMGVS